MSQKPEQFPNDEPVPQAPPDVAWLREAREHKGLTLDALASTTKITPKYLRALEAGATNQLPPTFFIRGFVKTYAKEVGLDPNQTADRYLRAIAPDAQATDGEDAATIVATAVARTGGVAFEQDDTAHLVQGRGPDRLGRLTLAAAMVGLVVYVGPSNWDGWSSKVAAVGVAQTPSEAVAPETTPAPASEVAAPQASADVAGGPLQFEMSPKGPCWFSATADGNQAQSELLQAGDKRPIEARDELVLRVGDPEACAFSINGRAGNSLGPAGVPVTVRMTKDNFGNFLLR